MKLKKIALEIFNNQSILNEYITNNMIYLRDYFKMTDEQKMQYLPQEYYYYFDDFLIETDSDFERPKENRPSNYLNEPDELVDMFDNDIELVEWLERNNSELYHKFAKYLFDKISNNTLPIPDSEYPAWSYFDNNPKLIKNQWLIHFTNDAISIAKEGFKYGVDDMEKLGLTTHLSEFDKKYGGYNFAYTLYDFQKYSQSSNSLSSEFKYGNEAVIFRASGIKVWHYGDEEPQVIFYGNTARDIIPIMNGENFTFGIYDKNDKILYESEYLIKIIGWIINNYRQYHKSLAY